MRCLYVDLDGTLLGRGGSILHDGAGAFSLSGVRAIQACDRAGAEVVLYSGRRQAQVSEDARLIGSRAYIYEVGCGVVIDGEEEFLTDELQPGEHSIYDQITTSGAPALLLDRYAGRLEYHDPWHRDREVSHLFRGAIDSFEADELLRSEGLGHLRMVDNGVIHRRSATLATTERLHAYHLIPGAASKVRAVARHMRARGYARGDCIAVGDSREDMEAAEVVGAFWLVGNALERDPALREAIAGRDNVRIAEEAHGAGVYEAVVTTLAERR
jgi:hydroxymethylpyrimidine pyrophosphatase-like HAD family hydrolase